MISRSADDFNFFGMSTEVATLATLPNLVDLVHEVVEMLPHPQEPEEKTRFDLVVDALLRLDGQAMMRLLDQPAHRFGGAYLQIETYALVVVGLARLDQWGYTVVSGEAARQTIRHQVRNELMTMPPNLETMWLIPVTPEDHTAAHVAALMLIRNAKLARPWIWAGIPDHGRFHLIGDGLNPRALSRHPLIDHHRCEGAISFAGLATSWPHSHA